MLSGAEHDCWSVAVVRWKIAGKSQACFNAQIENRGAQIICPFVEVYLVLMIVLSVRKKHKISLLSRLCNRITVIKNRSNFSTKYKKKKITQ